MTKTRNSGRELDLDTRRRRAAYRAHHRGTKEMDWLVGRFAEAYLDELSEPALAEFEWFLELPDPELQKWILDPSGPTGGAFDELITAIRVFHGLARPTEA